ncbi:MAG: ligand-gated ion channel [Pseudomonadota bacterium]
MGTRFHHIPIHMGQRLLRMFKRPVFWWLTIFTHGVVILGAILFYWLEQPANPAKITLTDALYWAIATATTVGYGDITTVTTAGKWLAMALMLLGTLVSALYTAVFASALIEADLEAFENEMMIKK